MQKLKTFIIILSIITSQISWATDKDNAKYYISYADLVEPLLPAVVNISTFKKAGNTVKRFDGFPPNSPFEEFNDFFERFGITPPRYNSPSDSEELRPYSGGSGFFIDDKGHIVTNQHLIADIDKITVTLHNDKKYDAEIVGSDSRTDLALLKIKPKEKISFVKFGDSSKSRVGDIIIAIGNPFGLGGTVTKGIISSKSRTINAGAMSLVDNFLQTDAAINQGNSGGPMFNMNGEVIGVNTAIYSPSGGNVGIGFAVPSSLVEPVITQIMKNGKVDRGWLGLTIKSTEDIAESMGIKDNKGALVVAMAKNGPAEKAGINVGDIILKFDGVEITDSKKLPKTVAATPVGKKVIVELLSKGKMKKIELIVGELDEKTERTSYSGKNSSPQSIEVVKGLYITEIDSDIAATYNLPSTQGVMVTNVAKNSAAGYIGIRKNDIIVAVNQKHVENPQDFINIIKQAKKDKRNAVMLWIKRGNANIFVQLTIK